MSKKLSLKTTLATSLTIPIIALTTTSIVSCSNQNITYRSQQLVDSINTTNYEVVVAKGINLLKLDHIIKNTIKEQLAENIKKNFKDSCFIISKIIKKDNKQNLSNEDLNTIKIISVEIYYKYKKFNKQTINLTIKIIPNDQEVVSAINNISDFEIDIESSNQMKYLGKKIDGFFIEKKLPENIKVVFKKNNFRLRSILKAADHQLQKEDYVAGESIDTKLRYFYKINETEDYLEGETKLKLNFNSSVKNDIQNYDEKLQQQQQQIINFVNGVKEYKGEIMFGQTIAKLKFLIIELIEKELYQKNQNNFNSTFFQITKMIKSDRQELQNTDLVASTKMQLTVSYDYGSLKNHNIILNLEVLPIDITKNKFIIDSFKISFELQQDLKVEDSTITKDWSRYYPHKWDVWTKMSEWLVGGTTTNESENDNEFLIKQALISKYFNKNSDDRFFKEYEQFVHDKEMLYNEDNYQIFITNDSKEKNSPAKIDISKNLYAKVSAKNNLIGTLILPIILQNQ